MEYNYIMHNSPSAELYVKNMELANEEPCIHVMRRLFIQDIIHTEVILVSDDEEDEIFSDYDPPSPAVFVTVTTQTQHPEFKDVAVQTEDSMIRPTCKVFLDILNEEVLVEPCCHVICEVCLRRWLAYKKTCPTCRKAIEKWKRIYIS